jgi:hypothetical protein
VVLAFDELQSSLFGPSDGVLSCPDCWADMRDEPADHGDAPRGRRESLCHRCTRCGAAWERNSAGWLFPLHAA